jgi:hypothetical protein
MSDNITIPPLPKPVFGPNQHEWGSYYDAGQMRQYALAAVRMDRAARGGFTSASTPTPQASPATK